jgi:hypothetical protein
MMAAQHESTDAASSVGLSRHNRMNPLVEFLSIFLLGLVTGVSFSHLLQRGPKATLSGAQFLAVQQVLLRNYGPAIGGLEVAALLSTLAVAIFTWQKPVVPFLAILACGCVVLMVTIWAVWINPINKLVNSWTPERLPTNWTDFRDRWHFLHTVRLFLSVVAFSAAIGAVFAKG